MKTYNCKDCDKKICRQTANYGSGKCHSCAILGNNNPNFDNHKLAGRNNPNFKNDKTNNNKCISCDQKISFHAKRCPKCCYIALRKPEKIILCKRCLKRISRGSKTELCRKCHDIVYPKKYSEETKQKMRENFRGKKSHFYKDGRTSLVILIRNLLESKQWRNEVFKRDNYICQECGQYGGQLEAHHQKEFHIIFAEFLKEYDQFSPIDDKETLVRLAMKYKSFWDINNGITMCRKCHDLTKRRTNDSSNYVF